MEARFKPSIRVGHFFFAAAHSFHLARTKACRSNVLLSAPRQPALLPDDHDDDGVADDVDSVGGEDEVGELTKAVLVCRREVGWLKWRQQDRSSYYQPANCPPKPIPVSYTRQITPNFNVSAGPAITMTRLSG